MSRENMSELVGKFAIALELLYKHAGKFEDCGYTGFDSWLDIIDALYDEQKCRENILIEGN